MADTTFFILGVVFGFATGSSIVLLLDCRRACFLAGENEELRERADLLLRLLQAKRKRLPGPSKN